MNPSISEQPWSKRFAMKYTLTLAVYNGYEFTQLNKKIFGVGFTKILFVYEKGIVTCFALQTDTDKLGKHLAEKADKKMINQMAEDSGRQTDNIKEYVKKPIGFFLNYKNFMEFRKAMHDYHPFQIGVKILPDYLPEDLQVHINILEDARLYSEHVYEIINDVFVKMAQEISKIENIDAKYIQCMYSDEFEDYLKTKRMIDEEILRQRYTLSGLYFSDDDCHPIGKEIDDIRKEIAKKHKKSITGRTAYPGQAKGICRIIKDPDKASFNEGEILVTEMTRPKFVPLMKKAAAIITDAGGMLCHAAIVARELKIPCIVGTEVATARLKDGDMIEVDAKKGHVKIISS